MTSARAVAERVVADCGNEHLAPQKCTAAAAVFTGGPEQSKPDERAWVDMPDDWTAGGLGGPPASGEHYYQHLQDCDKDDELLDAG